MPVYDDFLTKRVVGSRSACVPGLLAAFLLTPWFLRADWPPGGAVWRMLLLLEIALTRGVCSVRGRPKSRLSTLGVRVGVGVSRETVSASGAGRGAGSALLDVGVSWLRFT